MAHASEWNANGEDLDELQAAQHDVTTYGSQSHTFYEAAWQRVIEGMKELQQRFPPEAGSQL